MKAIETIYRDHTIVIRDVTAVPTTVATGTVEKPPVPARIIEVDHVDVTKWCRTVATDEQKAEEGRRYIDRNYPKGKS
jgi:hypothetical protein